MNDGDIRKIRLWLGFAVLCAALLVWAIVIMMSPHSESGTVDGVRHVQASAALFARNAALGTLVLVLVASALLFWRRRPERRALDMIALAVIGLLAATSFYQLLWIETDVLDVDEAQAAPIASEGT